MSILGGSLSSALSPSSSSNSESSYTPSGNSNSDAESGETSHNDDEDDDENEGSGDEQALSTSVVAYSINEVPVEIFTLIFEQACEDSPDPMRQAVNISHVSRLWRSVALSIPRLWKSVDIKKDLDLAVLFLKRSESSSFHAQICLGPHTSKADGIVRIQLFTDAIVDHRHRLGSLAFHFHHPIWLRRAYVFFTSPPVVQINRLDIRQLGAIEPYYPPAIYPTLQKLNLLPQHFRYEGCALPTHSVPLSKSLRTLNIKWVGARPLMADFVNLLAAANNLERLRVSSPMDHKAYEHPHDIRSGHLLSFPSLQDVELEGIESNTLNTFFNILHMPSLHKLLVSINSEIDSDGTRTSGSLMNVAQRHPQLQQLHLKYCQPLSARKWAAILENLPDLTHLELSYCQNTDWMLRSLATSPPVTCPRLLSITIVDNYFIPVRSVISLVMSRIGREDVSPIESVTCKGLSQKEAARMAEAIGHKVSRLVLECLDVDNLVHRLVSDRDSAIEEEWIRSGDETDLDSGDEDIVCQEVQATPSRPWGAT